MDLIIGVPLVVALGELLKKLGVPKKALPVSLVAASMVLFYFYGDANLKYNLLEGLVTAMAAMGLYSGAKASVEG